MNLVLSTILSLTLFIPSNVSNSGDLDVRHQAMYLFNLVRYIDWESDQVVIGVIGESPVSAELEKLASRNNKIEVKTFEDYSAVVDCNIVFLPNADNANFYLTQTAIGDQPILLVVDQKNLVIRGAEMGFYVEDKKLKFVANTEAIERTGIKVSHTLLEKAVSLH